MKQKNQDLAEVKSMIIDDFDWDKLYEKADVFMRNST